jgi:hypothetical protein
MANKPRLIYEEIRDYESEEVQDALSRDVPAELLRIVIGVALNHEDFHFGQSLCIRLAYHEHFNVRGNAVLGFGHLARRFRQLDEAHVRPIIEGALADSSEYVRGQAWAAADDIAHFLKWKIAGFDRA